MKERDRLLLCLDIGNTNITLGVFRGDEPALVARIATDADRTADQYAAEFSQLLSLRGVAPGQIDGCIISNVVPPLNTVTQSAVHGLCGVKALLLGPGVKTGLNIRIDNPAQLGADLVAAGFAPEDAATESCLRRWAGAPPDSFVRRSASVAWLASTRQLHDLEFILSHRDDFHAAMLLRGGELVRVAAPIGGEECA